MRTVLLLLLSLLPACMSGPDPADVAADRERYLAVRMTTADGVVSPEERPSFDVMLAAWDMKLSADEAAIVGHNDPQAIARDLLRAYGLAAVQVFLVPELQARAPEFFRLVDRNQDGTLDEAELLSIDPRNPAFAAVVLMTAVRLAQQ